jgi:hypothetical protein
MAGILGWTWSLCYGHVLALAAITSTDFPQLVHQRFLSPNPQSEDPTIVHSLAEIFAEINSQRLPRHLTGGCVAISILELEDKRYISNLGDARALDASWDPTTVLQWHRIRLRLSM